MPESPQRKLAIVTSYDDACGNATYSDVLAKEFNKRLPTEIVALDHFLLGLRGKTAIALGDRHIEKLCEKISQFDYVNIQFEYSLFGFYPWDVLRRFKKLIESAKNLVITFHRVELPKAKPNLWGFYNAVIDLNFMRYRRDIGMSDIYIRLIRAAADLGKTRNVRMVVHTPKEKKKVLVMAPEAKVDYFPLTYFTAEERTQYLAKKDSRAWKERLGFSAQTKVIGLFGFISTYKNFETPLKTLLQLGDDYVICLFGSQHPMSFEEEQKVLPYIRDLMELVQKSKKNIVSRVQFMGHVNDATMYEAIINSDVVVVPYLEVGQGMSGIAALCLELKANVIFSNNFSFNEIKHYCPEGVRTFDMGNYLELAQKVSRLEMTAHLSQKLDQYYEKYNIEGNISFYLNQFSPPATKEINSLAKN